MLLQSFVPLRWYTRKEAIVFVENTGKSTSDDYQSLALENHNYIEERVTPYETLQERITL